VTTQLYSHKWGVNAAFHLQRADSELVGYSLDDFIHDYGAPEHLMLDGAVVKVGFNTSFMDILRSSHIRWHVSGPRCPNENPTESSIREVKKQWHRMQEKKKTPLALEFRHFLDI
jgi:hypothetical protein